jgi:two-component system, NarL family, response regulator DevR
MKTIVVIDDHAFIRAGIADALSKSDYSVIGQAASKSEGLALLNSVSPDFCIVDLNLGDGLGSDLISEIKSKHMKTKFIVLTMDDEESSLQQAKLSGADAYILKSTPIDALIKSLAALERSNPVFHTAGKIVPKKILKHFELTKRELEILQLLGAGSTASEMGQQLFLTEATVKTHLSAIYRKLNASNRSQALSIAFENNLVQQ